MQTVHCCLFFFFFNGVQTLQKDISLSNMIISEKLRTWLNIYSGDIKILVNFSVKLSGILFITDWTLQSISYKSFYHRMLLEFTAEILHWHLIWCGLTDFRNTENLLAYLLQHLQLEVLVPLSLPYFFMIFLPGTWLIFFFNLSFTTCLHKPTPCFWQPVIVCLYLK